MPIDGVKKMQTAYQRNELPDPITKPPVNKAVETDAATTKVQPEQDRFSIHEPEAGDSLLTATMRQSDTSEQNKEAIKRTVGEMSKKAGGSEVVFGIHEDTNRVTIKILDKDTKKLIKEIPAEKTLDMIAKVWELAGLMVDEKG